MKAYVELMRPAQWIKNFAVLAGPAFAMRAGPSEIKNSGIIFAAFCLISSSSYVINDIFDREADALHPVKKHRPLARGAIGSGSAAVWAIVLFLAGVTMTLLLSAATTVTVVAYFVLIFAYSVALKRRTILDVVLIAIGFVLRAMAGAEAIEVVVSPWLVVCTFTLCMFMGFGKRRCEVGQFASLTEAGEHRIALLRYSPELLSQLISISAGITILTFLLYTMDGDIKTTFNKQHLVYTLPLVVYGIFRYAMLVQSGDMHGPMEIVLRDRPFQATVALWALSALFIMTEQHWVPAVGLEELFGLTNPMSNPNMNSQ